VGLRNGYTALSGVRRADGSRTTRTTHSTHMRLVSYARISTLCLCSLVSIYFLIYDITSPVRVLRRSSRGRRGPGRSRIVRHGLIGHGGSEVDCVFSVTDRPTRPGSDGPCPAGRVRPTDPVLTGRAQRGEKFWGRTRPTDRPSWD
jgi:hypothetical protein